MGKSWFPFLAVTSLAAALEAEHPGSQPASYLCSCWCRRHPALWHWALGVTLLPGDCPSSPGFMGEICLEVFGRARSSSPLVRRKVKGAGFIQTPRGCTSPFSGVFVFALSISLACVSTAKFAVGLQVITPVWKHEMPCKCQVFIKRALGWTNMTTFDMPKQVRTFKS